MYLVDCGGTDSGGGEGIKTKTLNHPGDKGDLFIEYSSFKHTVLPTKSTEVK